MSVAAEQPTSPFPELAEVAVLPAGADREQRAYNAVFSLVMDAGNDEVHRQRIRAEVLRLKLMPARLFDATAAEARRIDGELGGGEGQGAAASASPDAMPEGLEGVPGSPGWAYRPALGDFRGEVWKMAGKRWTRVLEWAPAVAEFLATPTESGAGVLAYYYVIRAGAQQVTTDARELALGEPWNLLPVTGTGARAVREVLTNVVRAEADRLQVGRALTRTGWHRDDSGDLFYVHADGHTSDGRPVVLVGLEQYGRLAAAAAPAPEMDTARIASALRRIAEHGRGPGLAGVGIGVRALAHSLHRVPGGYIAVGAPNAGKSSLGWHARCVSVARQGRADAWPPLASATFADTKTKIESALDYEADMPVLIDDAALTDKSSKSEVAEVTGRLEMVYRALANDTPVRGRMDRTMLPRPANYVRSPAIATIQGTVAAVPVQNSLLRRVALLPVRRGEIDVKWYRAPGNSGALVGPLRALGEHLVIGYLSALGGGAAGYVAAKDAEAREMLAAALEAIMPGWEDQAEGLAGVVDITACALGGLLIAAEVCNVPGAELAHTLLAYLASAVAEQATRMSDSADAATPAEALRDIISAALLNRRAHFRDHQGDIGPVIEGLTEQEQGLRAAVSRDGSTGWAGDGAPFYWLPDENAVGVRAAALHKLIKESGDTRFPEGLMPRTLPGYLIGEGLALASDQKTGNTTHQKWLEGGKTRLVYLRPGAVFTIAENSDEGSGRNGRNGRPQEERQDSNDATVADPERNGRPQVTGGFEAPPTPAALVAGDSNNAADMAPTVPTATPLRQAVGGAPTASTATPLRQAVGVASRALCRACNTVLSPWLREQGAEYHVSCAPDEAYLVFTEALGCTVPQDAAAAVRHLGQVPAPAARELGQRQAAAPAGDRPPPRRRWVVLGGGGRAYAAGGEVIALPGEGLAACTNAGELAALALELGAERCYVPREAREALGLPESLGDPRKVSEGVPHIWTEATEPAEWDIWPAEPVGLAGWMNVYRQPRTLHQGTALAFPEWLENTPALGELTAPELARALELIHLATTHHGEGRGGVEFFRSPASTFGRLLDKAARVSRNGRPEAIEPPPPYRREVKRPRGAPAPLKVPGSHDGAPAEVPEGWTVARLDVNSCFASAVSGTDFGIGDAVHSKGGELGRAPGAHLVRLPALAAVHPSLMPFGPPASAKGRDAIGWLDTLAARWLAENGVQVEVLESWTWPEVHRVFDSASQRLGEARARLEAAGGVPELAAAKVVKSMANAFLGGRLTSTYAGERNADDWQWRPDWWHSVRVQAEVRKQRNLLPALASGVLVLGELAVDSVYVAAPTLGHLEQMPGTGGRPAVAPGRGKFKIESHAPVTGELSAALADARKAGRDRLAAVKQALGEE